MYDWTKTTMNRTLLPFTNAENDEELWVARELIVGISREKHWDQTGENTFGPHHGEMVTVIHTQFQFAFRVLESVRDVRKALAGRE